MEGHGHEAFLPSSGSVYGSCLFSDFRNWDWIDWLETIPTFKLDPKTPFGSILVPTVDTIRYSHLLAMLVNNNKHVLAVGNTGVYVGSLCQPAACVSCVCVPLDT